MRSAGKHVLRYLFAMASVVAALVTEWLAGLHATGITPLFFAAIMLSTWVFGFGPGLVAAGLAGVASALFFMEPINSPVVGLDDLLRLAVFLGVAVLISYLLNAARRAQAEAVAANRAKDEFLAVLSHELRNPLNPILMTTQMQERDGSLPERVRESARLISRNAELQGRLIDDLLDLNRAKRGKLILNTEVVDVHEAIEHAAQICEGDREGKGLVLEMELEAKGHQVMGDGVRLRQVMWNLLRNAVKFTPAGGRITVRTGNGEGGCLWVTIEDTGIGIQPERLPQIFNAYEQGGEGVTRRFGGLGLGLTITKELVELHGGTITAESRGEGRGAMFRVTLPTTTVEEVEEVEEAGSASAKAGRRALAGRPGRILLVEDHADTARLMSQLLQLEGHAVEVAGTLERALDLAEQLEFDLVISDLGLPDGSGLELVQRLHERGPMRAIALSGYGQESDVRRSMEAGFAEHLTKPVDIERLEHAIARLMP